ncbi:hypothetical protein Tco_1167179 [Tanacetum coccineum]
MIVAINVFARYDDTAEFWSEQALLLSHRRVGRSGGSMPCISVDDGVDPYSLASGIGHSPIFRFTTRAGDSWPTVSENKMSLVPLTYQRILLTDENVASVGHVGNL